MNNLINNFQDWVFGRIAAQVGLLPAFAANFVMNNFGGDNYRGFRQVIWFAIVCVAIYVIAVCLWNVLGSKYFRAAATAFLLSTLLDIELGLEFYIHMGAWMFMWARTTFNRIGAFAIYTFYYRNAFVFYVFVVCDYLIWFWTIVLYCCAKVSDCFAAVYPRSLVNFLTKSYYLCCRVIDVATLIRIIFLIKKWFF